MIAPAKLIILIDGSSYIYRAFHALPPLSNTKGEPTGAVFGVISMIKKLITEYAPDYIAVVFDPKGKTHRDSLYEHYKAHRPPMPTELVSQVQYIYKIIEALGIPIAVFDGIEADDVIGTLATNASALGYTTLISTGDKDMAQLVSPSVTLINTMTGTIYDRDAVIHKFGILPELIIDYLSLTGDKVDNIPGVPNVGPKTAVKWLKEFGSLQGVIANASQIKGKVGENLRKALPDLALSKQLVTICTDLTLPIKATDLIKRDPQKESLIDLYKHLEFKTWLAELLEETTTQTHEQYETILDNQQLSDWISQLEQSETFALVVQATGTDGMQAELIGLAFAFAPKKAAYIPLGHDVELVPCQLAIVDVLKSLSPILANPNKTLLGENLKFTLNVLKRYGLDIQTKLYDTLLESYVQSSATVRHDRHTLALKYLGKKTINYEEIAGKGVKQIRCDKLDAKKVTQYAAESADIIFQLHEAMYSKIVKEADLLNVLSSIEMPLVKVLARIESNGVLIDDAMLKKHSLELKKRIQCLEEEAFALADCRFNLNSPKQLQAVLYEKMQIPITSKTPTGQPSTSESVLHELARYYPLPKLILEHRSLSKIKSTYADSLPQQVNVVTGRVHTCYNQAVTATGRLSSTDPNLQNIPIRHSEGRRIRQAFIAPEGCQIISADYSQIELRIMAHLSKDTGLLRAFDLKQDIHTATAAEIFKVDMEQVTQNQRRSAKAINFGLIYGMSPFGLSVQLGIERNLAQAYIDRYFERYPKILDYMESIRQLAHKQGYVETLTHRKLYLPDINAANLQRQRAAERAAINAPLQGTAAELIKMAMIQIDRWIQDSGTGIKMIMQVHDELVFEVPNEFVENSTETIRKLMVNVIDLEVPLVVDIGVGKNWDEAH